jgi:hypothetical protein
VHYPPLWQLAIGLTLAACLLFGCGSPPSAIPTPQPPPAKSAAVEPVVAMLATAASPLPSRATPGPFDPLFESVPRTVDAVDVQDETAYLNVGPILATLDVSDRRTPRLLGAVKLPVETITGIAVSDGYAYVATESGLRIVDVSNPARPLEVGAYLPPLITGDRIPQGITGVEVGQAAGQIYAYVAAQDAGLRVVDVSDPTHPQDKTVLPRTWAKDITIAGDTLYVAVEICPGQCGPGGSRDGSLHIFDLSNPASPASVSLWQPPGQAAVNPIEEPTVEPDLEMLVIQQVASEVCPVNNPGGEPTFDDSGTVYSFSCSVAAGHGIGARITRFPGQPEAQAAFNHTPDLSQEFHGCLAFEEQFDERTEPNQLPMRHSTHSWQVDRWLIEVSAFDDTGLALVGVLTVSEKIYQAAIAYGLIAAC